MMRVLADAAVIFRREMLHYRRQRAYWLGQTVLPLFFIAFLGFGLNDMVRLPTGTPYLAHLASGLLVLTLASGAIGSGFTLIQERESGFLRVLLVAPVARASLVLGKIVARGVASCLLAAVLLGVLVPFTPLGLAHPAVVLLAIVGVTTTLIALGLLLAVRLRNVESFRLLAALATIPLYLLSGIFYPISALRGPLGLLAHLNPLTYGVDLFRYGLVDVAELPAGRSAVLLALLSLLSVGLAIRFFEQRTGT